MRLRWDMALPSRFYWDLGLGAPSARRVGRPIGILQEEYDALPEPEKQRRLWLIVPEDLPSDPTWRGRVRRILYPGF